MPQRLDRERVGQFWVDHRMAAAGLFRVAQTNTDFRAVTARRDPALTSHRAVRRRRSP
jgi:hypothetical protein